MQRRTRISLLMLGGFAIASIVAVGAVLAHGGRPGPASGAFTVAESTVSGANVAFTADPAAGSASRVSLKEGNATHVLYESIAIETAANATPEGDLGARKGVYRIDDGAGNVLAFVDKPFAGVHATSVDGTTVTIVLAEGATVTLHEAVAKWSPAGATIEYATGQTATLVLSDGAAVTQDGSVLTVALGAGDSAHLRLTGDDVALGGGPGPHGMRPGGAHGAPRGGPLGHMRAGHHR